MYFPVLLANFYASFSIPTTMIQHIRHSLKTLWTNKILFYVFLLMFSKLFSVRKITVIEQDNVICPYLQRTFHFVSIDSHSMVKYREYLIPIGCKKPYHWFWWPYSSKRNPNPRFLLQIFDLEKKSRASAEQTTRFQQPACLADMPGGFGNLVQQGFLTPAAAFRSPCIVLPCAKTQDPNR